MATPRGYIPSNIPIPDPSTITGQVIDQAKLDVRNEFSAALLSIQNVLGARLDGMERLLEEKIQAQKEAARTQSETIAATFAKSESFFTKENDSLKSLITATKDGFTAALGNLTGRLDRGEGSSQGARFQVREHRENTVLHTAIIGGVVGFFVLVVAIAALWVSVSHSVGGRSEAGAAIAVAPLNPSALATPSK